MATLITNSQACYYAHSGTALKTHLNACIAMEENLHYFTHTKMAD